MTPTGGVITTPRSSAEQQGRLLRWSAAVFVFITGFAVVGATEHIDNAARLELWRTHDFLDEVLKFIERPGQRVVVLPVLLAVTVFLARRRSSIEPVLAAVVAIVLVNISVGLIKWWSERATPRLGGPEFFDDQTQRLLGTFPSGHATNVGMWAAFAWFLAAESNVRLRRIVRSVAVMWVGIIVSCSWARTTHWVTDLVAGVALGAMCACVGLLTAHRWSASRRRN